MKNLLLLGLFLISYNTFSKTVICDIETVTCGLPFIVEISAIGEMINNYGRVMDVDFSKDGEILKYCGDYSKPVRINSQRCSLLSK